MPLVHSHCNPYAAAICLQEKSATTQRSVVHTEVYTGIGNPTPSCCIQAEALPDEQGSPQSMQADGEGWESTDMEEYQEALSEVDGVLHLLADHSLAINVPDLQVRTPPPTVDPPPTAWVEVDTRLYTPPCVAATGEHSRLHVQTTDKH